MVKATKKTRLHQGKKKHKDADKNSLVGSRKMVI